MLGFSDVCEGSKDTPGTCVEKPPDGLRECTGLKPRSEFRKLPLRLEFWGLRLKWEWRGWGAGSLCPPT